MIEILLQFGCNCFHRNAKGDSVLHVAAINNSKASLDILASFVSEELYELRNRDGMTALDVATALRNVSFV